MKKWTKEDQLKWQRECIREDMKPDVKQPKQDNSNVKLAKIY